MEIRAHTFIHSNIEFTVPVAIEEYAEGAFKASVQGVGNLYVREHCV